MTKDAFLTELGNALLMVPESERAEALHYYREYIEDAVDAGRSEEEVVASLEAPGVVASRIRTEATLARAADRPTPRNTSRALAAVFGILSLPITLPLAICIIALAICVAAVAFAVIVAVAVSIAAIVAAAIVVGARSVYLLIIGAMTGSAAVFTLGLGLIGTALAIFAVILLCYVAVGVCRGVGHFFRWVSGKVSKGRAAK